MQKMQPVSPIMPKKVICLDPFFRRKAALPLATERPSFTPLGIEVEWSTPKGRTAIELFHFRQAWDLGNDSIVFREKDAPLSFLCSRATTFEWAGEIYLDVLSLLSGLYTKGIASRSVAEVMRELDEIAPIQRRKIQRVSQPPPKPRGLLVPGAEAAGFRLAGACLHPSQPVVYADIVWTSLDGIEPYFASIPTFRQQADGSLDEGQWQLPAFYGIPQMVRPMLERFAPKNPHQLLTKAGEDYVVSIFERREGK